LDQRQPVNLQPGQFLACRPGEAAQRSDKAARSSYAQKRTCPNFQAEPSGVSQTGRFVILISQCPPMSIEFNVDMNLEWTNLMNRRLIEEDTMSFQPKSPACLSPLWLARPLVRKIGSGLRMAQ
jgi:hypothetical protein